MPIIEDFYEKGQRARERNLNFSKEFKKKQKTKEKSSYKGGRQRVDLSVSEIKNRVKKLREKEERDLNDHINKLEEEAMKFRGEYNFLSNFYDCSVRVFGNIYMNAESAYQAQKFTGYPNIKQQFIGISGKRAKELANKYKNHVRKDWHDIKLEMMEIVLKAKFYQNFSLGVKLINTREPIVEENHWGDTFWGVCGGQGENHLGKIIEKVKKFIEKDPKYSIVNS